jgi:hypothetical protein
LEGELGNLREPYFADAICNEKFKSSVQEVELTECGKILGSEGLDHVDILGFYGGAF